MLDPSSPAPHGQTVAEHAGDGRDGASRERHGERFRPRIDAAGRPAVLIVTLRAPGAAARCHAASIVGQSLQSWTWLRVAGGAGAEEPPRPRVRIVAEHDPARVVERVNEEIRGSPSPYVAFVDARDALEPTTLERWAWSLEAMPRLPWVRSRSAIDGADGAPPDVAAALAFVASPLRSSSCLLARQTLLDVGGLDAAGPLDEAVERLWLRLAERGAWGASLPSSDIRSAPPADPERVARERAALAERFRERLGPAAGTLAAPAAGFVLREALPDASRIENPLATRERRLLLVLPYLFAGGSEKVCLDLVGALTRRGWHVTVVVTQQGEATWAPRFREHTADVLVLADFLFPTDLYTTPAADLPRFLAYLGRSRAPQAVLISNAAVAFGCVPWLRSLLPDVAFLGIHHAAHWPMFAVELDRVLDGVLVSYEGLRRRMVDAGVPASRVSPFYTGADTEVWRPDPAARAAVRADFGTSPRAAVLLFTGRWTNDKRPWMVVDAARRLAERGREIEVWIVGDGPERDRVAESAARARPLLPVRVIGSIDERELVRIVAAADLVVLPSLGEGISVTAFEALACGVPFVGADVGGQRELVTPDCGVLVPRDTAERELEAYASAIDLLLRDPAALAEMGGRARARVLRGFRIDDMADRVEAAIAAAQRAPLGEVEPGAAARVAASVALADHFFAQIANKSAEHLAALGRLRRDDSAARAAALARLELAEARLAAVESARDELVARLAAATRAAEDSSALHARLLGMRSVGLALRASAAVARVRRLLGR